MTVSRRQAPRNVLEIVAEAWAELAPAHRGRRRPRATEPLPLYHADARALVEDAGLNALAAVGWRTIVVDGRAASFADVEGFETPRFSRRTTGPSVARLIEAAARADPARAAAGTYELRIVESPCLKAAALWLAGEEHWFLPYAGLPAAPLALSDFLEMLKEKAGRQERAYVRAEAIRASGATRRRSPPAETEGGGTPPPAEPDREGEEPCP